MKTHWVSVYELYNGRSANDVIIEFIVSHMKDIINGKWDKFVSKNNCRIDGFNIKHIIIHNKIFYAIDVPNTQQLNMKPVYKIPFGIEQIDGKEVLVRYLIGDDKQNYLSV